LSAKPQPRIQGNRKKCIEDLSFNLQPGSGTGAAALPDVLLPSAMSQLAAGRRAMAKTSAKGKTSTTGKKSAAGKKSATAKKSASGKKSGKKKGSATAARPVASGATAFPPNRRVDQIFAQWDKPGSPGFALAVAQAGKIVYARGYGVADLDHNIPITPATVFHAASLSKQFTAMAIMLLVEQNKLKLSDHVHAHVPELKNAAVAPVPPIPHGSSCTPLKPVTIEQMLHHTSGIRDSWVLAGLAGWRLSDDVISRNDIVEDLVPRMKILNFEPGSDFSYSNTNYTLAGEIVRRVSGVSLAEFCRTHIFQKLGMTSTAFAETHGQIVRNRAYGYSGKYPAFAMRMPNYDLTGPTNLVTTVEDLMLWARNFDLLKVGGSSALTAMQTPVPASNGYGLGLEIGTDAQSRPTVEHDGRDPGHRSHLIRYPEQKLAIALLGNIQLPPNILTYDLVRSVAAIYLGAARAPAASAGSARPTHPAFAPADMNDYPGRYHSDEVDNFCDVIRHGSSIAIAHRQCDLAPMTAAGHDIFEMANFSVMLVSANVTFRRSHGKVDGFFIDDNAVPDRLRKFWFAKVA
jgi:CubicO group peptidase (beta-lactamase class C family)